MSNSPQHGPTALPQGANDGGDGSTKENATRVTGSDKTARSFVVKQAATYVRCNMWNALEFWDMGYHVFDISSGRRVKFEYRGPGRPQFAPFAHQHWKILQEEDAALVRGDRLPGEDLGEDAEEEFEIAGDRVFDTVQHAFSTPSRARRGNLVSSPSSGGRGRGSPSTPRGRGSSSQPGSGQGLGGRGSDGSRRSQGPHSPTSPSFGKGKGPAGSPGGGSPGAGAA